MVMSTQPEKIIVLSQDGVPVFASSHQEGVEGYAIRTETFLPTYTEITLVHYPTWNLGAEETLEYTVDNSTPYKDVTDAFLVQRLNEVERLHELLTEEIAKRKHQRASS